MKNVLLTSVLLALALAVMSGCKDLAPGESSNVPTTVATVNGRVVDNVNGNPLQGVTVEYASSQFNGSVTTATDGTFEFELEFARLDFTTITGTLSFSKSGYKLAQTSFAAEAGKTTRIYPDPMGLSRDTTTVIGGGGTSASYAHSIAFISATTRDIDVFGVGGTESSIIMFEVRDSLGFPISIDRRDTVTFSLIGVPVGGGAYVSPRVGLTNAAGRVATTVNSGTVSGPLQFIATLRRDTDGHIVTSTPVLIVVNAGLPSQTHFTVGPQQFNFAGYNWLGRQNPISVQVGDKYSNPVKTGTAVYFNTTGGIVEASIYTSETGHGTNVLFSGNPLPKATFDPLIYPPQFFGDGTGYGWVRAMTLGEGGAEVHDSVLILFSGLSTISITPSSSFAVPRLGSTNFTVQISDQNDNPLAPTTRIRTETIFAPPEGTNWAATATGLPDDEFSDMMTRGPGHTIFTLRVADGTPGGTPELMPVVVKISVTSPNGNVFTTLSGTVGGPTP